MVEVGADDLAGQVDRARPLAEEGRAVLLPLAEARGVALAISVLARCDQQEGDLAGATARFGEALDLLVSAGVERGVPTVLDDLAGVVAARGRPARDA